MINRDTRKRFRPAVSKIISKDNRLLRDCVKLGQKKYRDESGAVLLEGGNIIDEAVKSGRAVLMLFREGTELPAKYKGVPSVAVKKSLFGALSDTKNGRGIVCVAEKPERDEKSFFREAGAAGSNILVMDRVQDPGNAGTMIRTAEAAGYSGVITVKGTVDLFSPKVVRSAAGSVMRVPLLEAEGPGDVRGIADRCGKKLVGTVLTGGKDMSAADLGKDIMLVIGNEGSGISGELLSMTDENVMIPMKGGTESLNAAVAAAVLMYRSI